MEQFWSQDDNVIDAILRSPDLKLQESTKQSFDKSVANMVIATIDQSQNQSQNARSSRQVRRPVSYKETPLNTKVRKGFKFFKFDD